MNIIFRFFKKYILLSIYYFLHFSMYMYLKFTDYFVPKLRYHQRYNLLNGQRFSEYIYLGKNTICTYQDDTIDLKKYFDNKNYILNITLMYENGDGIIGVHEYDLTEEFRRFALYFDVNSQFTWGQVIEYILHIAKLDNYRFNKTAELVIYKNDDEFTDKTLIIKDIYDLPFNITSVV